MYRIVCVICMLFCVNSIVNAQRVFRPMLNYTGDAVGNFSGGDKRTFQWMGVLDAGVQVASDSLHWWKGGMLNVEFISAHGKGISATTLHDLQGICGIEAGNNPLLIWEVWYHQQFDKLGVRIGFQNVNSDFMLQSLTDAFSGGSYQTFPTLTLNYSLPNYPTAGLGISLSYQFNKRWSLLTSLFNGRVANISSKNRFEQAWRLNPRKDGILSIVELKCASDSVILLRYLYGLGFVFHNKNFASIKDSTKSYKNNYAFYAFGEHNFYRTPTRSAGMFLQGSYALKNRNMAYAYSAVGIVANGFLSKSHTDIVGVGLTQLYYQSTENDRMKNKTESSLEVFVKYRINKYLNLKPTFFVVASSVGATITAGMIEFGITIF